MIALHLSSFVERVDCFTNGPESFALATLGTSVVDTIGCGDAYFALSSIAAAGVAQRRGNESAVSEQEFVT